MTQELQTYQIAEFTVQSYFDEETTARLLAYARKRKLIGRTKPPRRAFLGLTGKLLWEKRFAYRGRRYVIQGGGKIISIFEELNEDEQAMAESDLHHCVICEMQHPEQDLVATEQGMVCRPCYDVWYPACEKCGRRFALAKDADPEIGPFICDSCRETIDEPFA